MSEIKALEETLNIVSKTNNGIYSAIISPTVDHYNALTELHIAKQDSIVGRMIENPASDISIDLNNPDKQTHFSSKKLVTPSELKFTNTGAKRGNITSLCWRKQSFWSSEQILAVAYNNVQNLTDIQKILAIWRFGKRIHIHSAPSGSWDDKANLDPIVNINSYGYGTCGHSAHMIAGLMALAGFSARVRNIPGVHTFPEVLLGEKWLIVDVNGETWFGNPETSKGLLSFEDLQIQKEEFWPSQHFRPLARYKSRDSLWEKFRNATDSKIVYEITPEQAQERYNKPFVLPIEPYETISFLPLNKTPSKVQANLALWQENWSHPQSIRTMLCQRNWQRPRLSELIKSGISNIDTDGQTRLIIPIPKRPFPLVDIEVSISLDKAIDSSPSLAILDASSGNSIHFSPVPSSEKKNSYLFRLRRGFIKKTELADTEFQIALSIEGGASISAIELIEYRQFSSLTFPAICACGMEVSFGSDIKEQLSANISFVAAGWLLDKATLSPYFDAKEEPSTNEGKALSWNLPLKVDCTEIVPSDHFAYMPHIIRDKSRQELTIPIGIYFEFVIEIGHNEFLLPSAIFHKYLSSANVQLTKQELEMLSPKKTYYWSVRMVDGNKRPVGNWSLPQKFHLTSKKSEGL